MSTACRVDVVVDTSSSAIDPRLASHLSAMASFAWSLSWMVTSSRRARRDRRKDRDEIYATWSTDHLNPFVVKEGSSHAHIVYSCIEEVGALLPDHQQQLVTPLCCRYRRRFSVMANRGHLQWASDLVANNAGASYPIEGFRGPVLLLTDSGLGLQTLSDCLG